jgi:hypothetical protein
MVSGESGDYAIVRTVSQYGGIWVTDTPGVSVCAPAPGALRHLRESAWRDILVALILPNNQTNVCLLATTIGIIAGLHQQLVNGGVRMTFEDRTTSRVGQSTKAYPKSFEAAWLASKSQGFHIDHQNRICRSLERYPVS